MSELDASAPFLRTLAPLLRGLATQLRGWLDARRRYPIGVIQRGEIEGVTVDLHRKADALDVDRPLLVIILLGGTGVGKSTLMNALAGAPVALASFTRPTTRDPVVYLHNAVKPDKLDAALQHCRFAQHDREALRHKIIVDTPDVDSNDLVNREKLQEVLPVADVVLYVGSQEKYHDQTVWELFKHQRQRRAFAFVLNKWDRCIDAGTGLRPDEDLLHDLAAEGFDAPKLFRTTAQLWVDAQGEGRETPADLPPGEQFAELVAWLENGLTRLEIDAVKARGVGQLIRQAEEALRDITPPDFSVQAARVRTAWGEVLREEADTQAEVLLGTLEPYQQEVEHHFQVRSQQNFWGLTAGWLKLTTRAKYLGTSLRDRLPLLPKSTTKVETPTAWNLTEFALNCTRAAGERVLTQRLGALGNKLLVEADAKGFPLALLAEATTTANAKQDWNKRFARSLVDALGEVEAEVTRPTGAQKFVRGGVTLLANALPPITLLASMAVVLYQTFVLLEKPDLVMLLLPLYATLAALVFSSVLVAVVLPVRWPRIRDRFQSRLNGKLTGELGEVFLPLPDETAAAVRAEKKQAEALVTEVQQIAGWLSTKEQASQVAGLYGS